MINLVGGGRLTSNDLAFQEFIMMPVGARSFNEALRMASETHMALQEIVVARYGKLSANTGDEGDFATPIVDVHEALALVREGVAAAGYADDVVYALDCAAAHLWDPETRLLHRIGPHLHHGADDRALQGARARLRRGLDRRSPRRGGLGGLRHPASELADVQIGS